MISLFGKATDRLCKKLDAAASDGEDVEMESLFSRLTLDIIGKALFNYDFDSLTNDTGIVEVLLWSCSLFVNPQSTHPLSDFDSSFGLWFCLFRKNSIFIWKIIFSHLLVIAILYAQAVYTVLREAEDRSISPIPVWDIPVWKDISPRQKKVNASLKVINDALNDLIAICKVIICLWTFWVHDFRQLYFNLHISHNTIY